MNPIKAYRDYRAAKPLIDFIERIDMKSSLFSWKTTIAGLITLGMPVAAHFGYVTMEQAGLILSLAAGFGLIAAKDGNVTGGTKGQPSTPKALAEANQAPSPVNPPQQKP